MTVNPPPAQANFEVRVIASRPEYLELGADLQKSLLDHDVWNLLSNGLGSLPRNSPGRFPVIMTRGSLPFEALGLMTWDCSNNSRDAILIRGSSPNETGAHELFHAFSRGLGGAVNPDYDETWWEEASAEWFQAKAGYGEDKLYDNNLQFPNMPLDEPVYKGRNSPPSTYPYAMSRFVQFLDDQGYISSGSNWPLTKYAISRYPAATEAVDERLRARGTTLGDKAAAFWGDRILENPAHGEQLVANGQAGTRRVEVEVGSDTIDMFADRLHTKMVELIPGDDVSRIEIDFPAEAGAQFYAAVEQNRSERVDNQTLSFCVNGGGTDELEWPVTLPVTFTNTKLANGQVNGQIDIRAQRDPGQCNNNQAPNNRACQLLADAGVSSLFGAGLFPFFSSDRDSETSSWLCFYEGEATEVNLNLFRFRTATTKQVRDSVRIQIRELNMRKVDVGDLAGIVTEQFDGKPANLMTVASGREVLFLIVGPSTDQEQTIRLAKRLVGQID